MLKRAGAVIICIISTVYANSFDLLQQLQSSRDYSKLIQIADSLIHAGVDSAWVKAFEGRAYADLGQYDNALPYLKSVYESPQNIPKWLWAWNTFYLGKTYLFKKETEKATALFKEVIETRITKNVVAEANRYMNVVPNSPFYKQWTKIETRNFNFLFHKKTKLRSPQEFAQKMQLVFDTINVFFNAEIPGKIDFFVWNNNVQFPGTPKYPGGFAIPELLIVHSRYMQTPGHEMTHIITHYAVDTVKYISAIINEGVATLFNMTHVNRIEEARKHLSGQSISIEELWKSDLAFRKLPSQLSYSLAAAFVEHLLAEGNKENFHKLLSDQSWSNAQNIYGDKLAEMIDGFWSRLN